MAVEDRIKRKANPMDHRTPALPYPIGINVVVYKDDGNWDNYRQWFLRTQAQLEKLFVARITLSHYEGIEEPAYTHAEWVRKSASLVEKYPNCIFVYSSNNV
jgi:hypothetical protein